MRVSLTLVYSTVRHRDTNDLQGPVLKKKISERSSTGFNELEKTTAYVCIVLPTQRFIFVVKTTALFSKLIVYISCLREISVVRWCSNTTITQPHEEGALCATAFYIKTRSGPKIPAVGHLEGRAFLGLDPFCKIKYFKMLFC